MDIPSTKLTTVPNVPPCANLGNTNNKVGGSRRNWFFTYNNYLKSELNVINKHFDKICSKYVFQEEMGSCPHLQGHIKLKKKKRWSNIMDGCVATNSKKIHWEPTISGESATKYCSKVRSRNGKTYVKGFIIPEFIDCIQYKDLYNWQLKILDLIENDDNRTIHWFYEKTGNTGKSALCKYLAINNGALVLSNKGTDMKNGIVNYHKLFGFYPKLIVVDIPRSVDQKYLSWTGIEEIKNGLFFSSKYESGMVIMNSPCVLIFSNVRPNIRKISKDRWYIGQITSGSLVKYEMEEANDSSSDEDSEYTI